MSKHAIPPSDQEMTLVQHLLELRNAMTKAVLAILVIFLVLFPFANDLYVYISEPLSRYLPAGTSMIATGVASPFLTPFKLSLIMAIYVAMPYLLYQLWTFIAPALYTHEKQLVGPILFFSSFLFYAGGAFAFYVVFPLVFGFLSTTAPEGVTIATDIALYLDFVIKMFFAFGIAFEVPVIVVLLILTGMTSAEKLSHARPYIVVAAFVIGMLLTPPDIVSQTLLAIPMWLLYETGVIVGAYVKKKRDAAKLRRETKEGKSTDETGKTQTPESAKTTAASATEDEMEFDDRYADQVDDDDDWDEAFDEIDSAFGALDLEHEARKKEKDADGGQTSDNESDSSTENADNSNDPSDAQTNDSEKRPSDKPE